MFSKAERTERGEAALKRPIQGNERESTVQARWFACLTEQAEELI